MDVNNICNYCTSKTSKSVTNKKSEIPIKFKIIATLLRHEPWQNQHFVMTSLEERLSRKYDVQHTLHQKINI